MGLSPGGTRDVKFCLQYRLQVMVAGGLLLIHSLVGLRHLTRQQRNTSECQLIFRPVPGFYNPLKAQQIVLHVLPQLILRGHRVTMLSVLEPVIIFWSPKRGCIHHGNILTHLKRCLQMQSWTACVEALVGSGQAKVLAVGSGQGRGQICSQASRHAQQSCPVPPRDMVATATSSALDDDGRGMVSHTRFTLILSTVLAAGNPVLSAAWEGGLSSSD